MPTDLHDVRPICALTGLLERLVLRRFDRAAAHHVFPQTVPAAPAIGASNTHRGSEASSDAVLGGKFDQFAEMGTMTEPIVPTVLLAEGVSPRSTARVTCSPRSAARVRRNPTARPEPG